MYLTETQATLSTGHRATNRNHGKLLSMSNMYPTGPTKYLNVNLDATGESTVPVSYETPPCYSGIVKSKQFLFFMRHHRVTQA
jgi:hypothetical protein